MTAHTRPAPGEPALTAEGKRIGTWVPHASGVMVLDKGTLDPERHLWKARKAWGTDETLLDRMDTNDAVHFRVPDGTEYWATHWMYLAFGFPLGVGGGGRQWFLPDHRWERALPDPVDTGADGAPATADELEDMPEPVLEPPPDAPADGKWRPLLSALVPSPFQPPERARADLKSLKDLAESLRECGQFNPIHVRVMRPGLMRVMDGNRRATAARLLGWRDVWAEPHLEVQSDEAELRFIQEINTQVKHYGATDQMSAFIVSGQSLPVFVSSSIPRVQKRLGRWLLRFPDPVEAERLMRTFRTPEALSVAIRLVRYAGTARGARERSAPYAAEAEMLRWMALDEGRYLAQMHKTPLFDKPTAAQVRRAMQRGTPYSALLSGKRAGTVPEEPASA